MPEDVLKMAQDAGRPLVPLPQRPPVLRRSLRAPDADQQLRGVRRADWGLEPRPAVDERGHRERGHGLLPEHQRGGQVRALLPAPRSDEVSDRFLTARALNPTSLRAARYLHSAMVVGGRPSGGLERRRGPAREQGLREPARAARCGAGGGDGGQILAERVAGSSRPRRSRPVRRFRRRWRRVVVLVLVLVLVMLLLLLLLLMGAVPPTAKRMTAEKWSGGER